MEKILFISPSTPCRKTWIISGVGFLLTVVILVPVYRVFLLHNISVVLLNVIVLFTIGITVLTVCSTPHKFILTNSHFIIKRRLKDSHIPLQNIKSIRLLTAADKKKYYISDGWDIRGPFTSYPTKRKSLISYQRRWDNWTLLITDCGKFLITPDDLQLIEATMLQINNVNADATTDSPAIDTPTNNLLKWLPATIVVLVFLFISLTYIQPKVSIESNVFKMKGIYGINIPLSEIAEVDTISLREMPAIAIRTNGISLFKVHSGNFRTTDGEKIRLNFHSGVNPVIRMIDSKGAIYFINRKNPSETREIFNELIMKR